MKTTNPRFSPLWNNLKQRLKRKPINIFCCGSSNLVLDTTAGEQPLIVNGPAPSETNTMNLATALAADRRQMNVGPRDGMVVRPLKTMVRLFEIDDGDVTAAEDGGGVVGTVCCVCADMWIGAALIPCGHTYCRVCCRAMWSKQESCPICSRSITEILEIF